MRRIVFIMACGALAFGCDDGRGGGEDSGGITLMDSGPGFDAGGGGDDAGGSTTCPPMELPAPAEPACESATLTCIQGCQGTCPMGSPANCFPDCLNGCIAADAMPMECNGCLNESIIACGTRNGCDQEWGDVDCCIQDNCPADGACIDEGGTCAPTLDDFFTCFDGLPDNACAGVVLVCFPL